jgi:FKBP-type peptidyl-prolyl cis-trans isomerase (trigger factor)
MELFKKIITTVLAALLLTSCSSMNSAITVGDKEFSINDLQKPVDEILEARKSFDTSQVQLASGVELGRNQAQFAIISVLLDQIASDMKINFTNADIAKRRTEIVAQVGGEAELPKALASSNLAASNLEPYIKVRLIIDKLTSDLVELGVSPEQASEEVSKLIVATAKKLGVEVNPKYGKWNAANASIESGDITDGAVTPAP